jgi:phage terminase small subunit
MDTTLTRRQENFITALLGCPTILQAAHTAGIAVATATRWLKEPAVQAAYREARRAVVQHAIVQVQQATGEAVETLRAVMQDPDAPASAKVSAARTILETAIKAVEIEDLDARITALEQQAQKP